MNKNLEVPETENAIHFLNVGTKMLVKDTMDQFLRSLGKYLYKTYYAQTMQSALRVFSENTIHVLITEVELDDGSAYRLLEKLGGIEDLEDDLYVILAVEEKDPALYALAKELDVHAVLLKPFKAIDLREKMDAYKAWREMPKDPWQLLVREAQLALREKKFREAEVNFSEAIRSAPENPKNLFRVGQYYLNKPDYRLAERLFNQVLIIQPDSVPALSALGTLFLKQHDLDRAEDYFKKAQKLSPLHPDRWLELARLYLEQSVDSCKVSLRADKANIAARFLLGKLLALQKDYIGSVRELEIAVPALKDESKNEAMTFTALSRKLGSIAKELK